MMKMKKIIAMMLAFAMAVSMTACKKDAESKKVTETDKKQETKVEQNQIDEEKLYADPIAFSIELENGGVMKGELYPNLAPATVSNFVKLAKSGFYDGLIFHRVIKDFMIQGGGYDKDMNIMDSEMIPGEFNSNGFTNPLKHTKGVISMARTSAPNSASSQFFIMHKDSPHLDGEYAAFGKITEGLEYIDEIAEAKTTEYQEYGMSDVPEEPIIIKTIKIDG